jgi:hypothetical protein
MPSAAGATLGLRGAAVGFGAGARFGGVARFGTAVAFGGDVRLRTTVRFRAAGFRAPAFRAPSLGAGARFLTAAPLCATFRFVTGADLAAGDCLRALGAVAFARDGLRRDFLAGVALARAGFFRAPCLAACAALAFLRACLAAFLLAFASFRARLSTAFASRICRFAVAARATAFFASALRRCAAADCFAPRF